MKKKILIWFLLTAVIVAGVSFRIMAKNKLKYVSVTTARSSKGEIKAYLSTTGTVKSKNYKAYYGLQGKVKKINVKVGDLVNRGDVLINYEVPDLNTAVKQAEIQYNNALLVRADLKKQNEQIKTKIAESNLDNQIAMLSKKALDVTKQIDEIKGSTSALIERKLIKLNAELEEIRQQEADLKQQRAAFQPISSEKFKQADNAVNLAKLALDSAKKSLAQNKDSIISEIAGIVTSVSAAEGASGNGMQPAVEVQDLDNLKMIVSIGRYDVPKVKLDQEALIRSEDQEYKGKVSFINPSATKSEVPTGGDTTLGVEIDILDRTPNLKVDFDADVDILLGEVKDALKIPSESVKIDKSGKAFVYTVQGSKAAERVVRLGLQSDREIQVLSGIKIGDEVILNPGTAIKNGTLIKEAERDKR